MYVNYVCFIPVLRQEVSASALAAPDFGVVLLLTQGSPRTADGDVNGVAREAGAALAVASGRGRPHQQAVPVDGGIGIDIDIVHFRFLHGLLEIVGQGGHLPVRGRTSVLERGAISQHSYHSTSSSSQAPRGSWNLD